MEDVTPGLFDELVEFVVENYDHKIVEVGIGHRGSVAEMMKSRMPNVEVLVTDNRDSIISSYVGGDIQAIVDDVFSPSLQAYREASLIYSLNPPMEMIPPLEQLARSVGADLLVKPISDEQDIFYHTKWEQLVKQGHTIGWLLRIYSAVRDSQS